MKLFELTLARSYHVRIKAETEAEAKDCAEFFLSIPSDSGDNADRELRCYKIMTVKLVENDAMACEEIEE